MVTRRPIKWHAHSYHYAHRSQFSGQKEKGRLFMKSLVIINQITNDFLRSELAQTKMSRTQKSILGRKKIKSSRFTGSFQYFLPSSQRKQFFHVKQELTVARDD
jgi:hypothetical protein